MSRWLTIWVLFVGLLARAENPAEPLLLAGVAEFTTAYEAWDENRFRKAAELFRQATTSAPASAACFYWLGVAEFHRMLWLQNPPTPPTSQTNPDAASAAMDTAIAALTRAVKLEPRHAESHALLGTLYGMKIEGNLLRAVRFGPRVDKHRQQALAHGPDNPRVQYLLGACQFHTARKPDALREALAILLRAQKLFEAEAEAAHGPLDPQWGYSSCLMFIGRAYEQLGQHKEAADYYRKALARQPADHLARQGLMRVSKDK